MLYSGKKILLTYVVPNSPVAYAYLDGVGWRRIRPDSADGITNVLAVMSTAAAHGRQVTVNVDIDELIEYAYLQ